jgi:hypothetical protein
MKARKILGFSDQSTSMACLWHFFWSIISIHCRTGSLEMVNLRIPALINIHCRTGSLESTGSLETLMQNIHCRIGSL